jgi:hypothetical protein
VSVFVDCPKCGTAAPAFTTEHFVKPYIACGRRIVREYDADITVKGPNGTLACRGCGAFYAPREVNGLPKHLRSKYGSKCDGRCTSGKRNCDCKCGGLCHGCGECVCGTGEELGADLLLVDGPASSRLREAAQTIKKLLAEREQAREHIDFLTDSDERLRSRLREAGRQLGGKTE